MMMINDDQALAAAGRLAHQATGRPEGALTRIPSRSHYVFVGDAVVVKLIDADDHARLDRELMLAADLPAGLSAPVLSSGLSAVDDDMIRYACLARLPGQAPGMGLPGVNRGTALRWAGQAIERLTRLHGWPPGPAAADCLQQPLDHGGFVGRDELLTRFEVMRRLDEHALLPDAVWDGLTTIAEQGPDAPEFTVVVHADCHWDNWLVHNDEVTALLDFEWARFGEPVDDWMFLARFSGPHMMAVLSLIADVTGTSLDELRRACELRESAYVSADLRLALEAAPTNARAATVAANLAEELRQLMVERTWWQSA